MKLLALNAFLRMPIMWSC